MLHLRAISMSNTETISFPPQTMQPSIPFPIRHYMSLCDTVYKAEGVKIHLNMGRTYCMKQARRPQPESNMRPTAVPQIISCVKQSPDVS